MIGMLRILRMLRMLRPRGLEIPRSACVIIININIIIIIIIIIITIVFAPSPFAPSAGCNIAVVKKLATSLNWSDNN